MTIRDLEILRTLLRLQVATTGALAETFFTQLKLAQRRLRRLRERGLITAHERGLRGPMASDARYWRLTSMGLAMVAEAFPNEPVANNFLDRVAKASLRNSEHRNAIAELYLALIADRDQDPSEIRARAEAFRWYGDYDVVLPFHDREGVERVERRIIPDATLETPSTRIFLEVDRSTQSLSRCRHVMRSYGRHLAQGNYAATFQDQLTPYVVYVAKSKARRENLQAAADALSLPLPVAVLTADQAPAWFSAAAIEVEAPVTGPVEVPPPPWSAPARAAVQALYALARDGLDVRRAIGDDEGAREVEARLAEARGPLEGALHAGS
jgi:hypothetical protein